MGFKLKLLVGFLGALSLVLSACSSSGGGSSQDWGAAEAHFLNICEQGGFGSHCECALEKAKQDYTEKEAWTMSDGQIAEVMDTRVGKCLDEGR